MSDIKVLQSWKEIARYLNRGVRTVQRWEAHFGLPIHRPSGRFRSAVLALPSELDQWLAHTDTRTFDHSDMTRAELEAEVARLRAECNLLRVQLQSYLALDDRPKRVSSIAS